MGSVAAALTNLINEVADDYVARFAALHKEAPECAHDDEKQYGPLHNVIFLPLFAYVLLITLVFVDRQPIAPACCYCLIPSSSFVVLFAVGLRRKVRL